MIEDGTDSHSFDVGNGAARFVFSVLGSYGRLSGKWRILDIV